MAHWCLGLGVALFVIASFQGCYCAAPFGVVILFLLVPLFRGRLWQRLAASVLIVVSIWAAYDNARLDRAFKVRQSWLETHHEEGQ